MVYCIIWNNFRIFNLQWDSQITWWLCFLGVDLGFYIFHRLSHGMTQYFMINIEFSNF